MTESSAIVSLVLPAPISWTSSSTVYIHLPS